MQNPLSRVFLLFYFLICTDLSYSQCCGGGSGSPMAGGSSQGVLQYRQFEINSNYQHINTNKFLKGDSVTKDFLDNYNSNYIYSRLAYGISKDFTMSIESGYWLNKTQVGLNKKETLIGSGIGDLILFPRLDVINKTHETSRTELTFGLGFKFPLGKYNDFEEKIDSFTNQSYNSTKPLAVQTSSGSNDFIFYSFFFKGYPLLNFRVFSNAIYIRKGWNPRGEKIGDYASIGLFAGKTFFDKIGITLQFKYEWVNKMELDMYAIPSNDPEATGSKKIFFVPQLSYSFKGLVIYGLYEIPVYQYVTKTQIASQTQFTLGISYRFFAVKNVVEEKKED